MHTFAFSNRKPTEAGFTLVEIAIVLVIVGLLLGGILKGQEMINQARIKNAINDFNGITVAVTSYQDRYRALPGDDPNATARWTVQAPVSGNGNGTVQGLYNSVTANDESRLFWQHLRIAGFVPGLTTGANAQAQPANSVAGIMGAESGVVGTSGLGFTTLMVCSSNFPDKVAIAVDTQMDDTNPATGQVRAQLQTQSNPPTNANPATGYVETGVSQYLLCKTF